MNKQEELKEIKELKKEIQEQELILAEKTNSIVRRQIYEENILPRLKKIKELIKK